MKKNIIFVTGFFGSPIMQRARQLAGENSCPLISLDDEIERADGRSVRRICMTMGEHEYRNKEYESLKSISEGKTPASGAQAAEDQSQPAGAQAAEDQSQASGAQAAESTAPAADLVVACGDGVLLDDMSRELILGYTLVITGADMTCEALWENARTDVESCHAFMHFGTEEKRREAFEKLFERQRALFMPYIK